MAVSAKDVMELRRQTDCGMMECKKALVKADGDINKAIEILREEGLATAAKKAGRIAAEGMVYAVANANGAVVVEVNAETDFVAKNDKFVEFTKDLANVVAEQKPADVEALMGCKMGEGTVDEALKALILVIKENIKVRRFAFYEGHCAAYVHGGGRIGVLVNFKLGDDAKAADETFKAAAKDIAMQIAAVMPRYVKEDEVPAEVVEKEKEILKAQALNEGKPEAIVEKMVGGRIKKFYKEVCLVDQPYIKDGDMSVAQFLKNVGNEIGTTVEVVKFARLEKGEGLEKKVDDFAAEVAKMTSGN